MDSSPRSLDRVQHDPILAGFGAPGETRQVRRVFLADIVGVYDVYRGGPAPSIVDAVQIPVNDPMMVVPVMAAVTEHIGFGVTANLTYEPPYLFARRMSTLDHLTGGRVGWNIVTGYLDSAARGMGLAAQPDHDGRYDAADELSLIHI